MTPVDYALIADGGTQRAPSITHSRRTFQAGNGHELSDQDLVSLIIGSARRRPIPDRGSLPLAEDTWQDTSGDASFWSVLTSVQGVRLAAALELGRRRAVSDPASSYLRTPTDVYEATADLRVRRREHFVGLYLNTRNRLICRETISVGSLNASIVHPREVFSPAIRESAASVVVVHNHPSGETDPSEDDIVITRRLEEAGTILGIGLLDHVIVGCGGFTSLKEQNLL